MRCSSSSVTDQPDFFRFLEGALRTLALQVPLAYAAMCRDLRGLPVHITVDGVSRLLEMTDRGHDLRPPTEAEAPLHLITTRGAIGALLDGRTTLRDSVREDHFALRGKTEHLVRLEVGLFALVQGAARSRQVGILLAEYLDEHRDPSLDRNQNEHAFERMNS